MFTVTDDGIEYNIAPTSTAEEVLQNVRVILKTRRGTVPLNRDFGLSWEYIDMPINQAQAAMRMDITEQITRFEPRARIIDLQLLPSDAANGRLKPKLTIAVNA